MTEHDAMREAVRADILRAYGPAIVAMEVDEQAALSAPGPTLAEIAALLDAFPPPKHRELRCHPSVVAALRMTVPEAEPKFPWTGAIGSLTGIPVIENPDLGPLCWELYENGKMIDSGQLGTHPDYRQEWAP